MKCSHCRGRLFREDGELHCLNCGRGVEPPRIEAVRREPQSRHCMDCGARVWPGSKRCVPCSRRAVGGRV